MTPGVFRCRGADALRIFNATSLFTACRERVLPQMRGKTARVRNSSLFFVRGPFAKGSGMACSINGENVPCAAEEYGEAAWGRICFTVKPGAAYEICVRSENERGGADLSAAV